MKLLLNQRWKKKANRTKWNQTEYYHNYRNPMNFHRNHGSNVILNDHRADCLYVKMNQMLNVTYDDCLHHENSGVNDPHSFA